MHEGRRRAIAAAFVANLGIAAAKFTGSQGLLFLGVPIARVIYLEPDLY